MTRIGTLDITGTANGPSVVLQLKGSADLRDGAELAQQFLQWHHAAVKAKATEVRIDVREVEFMNSTALGAFVGWISEMQKLTGPQRYHLYFEATQQRRWQRSSLHALASFAPEDITVSYS